MASVSNSSAPNNKRKIVFKAPAKQITRDEPMDEGDTAIQESHMNVLHTSHDANMHRVRQSLTSKLILKVFRYLNSPMDRLAAVQVCKDWNAVSKEKQLWHDLDLSHVTPFLVKDPLLRNLIARSGAMQSFQLNNAALLSYTLGIKPVLSAFETLHTLSLANTSNLSYDGITAIVKTCKVLRHLDLGACSVSNFTLEAIAQAPYASQLVDLSLRASTLITDDGVHKLLSTVRYLQTFDLSWCQELSYVTVEHIVSTLPLASTLRVLNLRWCRKMAQIAIPLLSHLQQLTWLSVSNIGRGLPKQPEVGLEPVYALVKLPRLEYLDVTGLADLATGAGATVLNSRVPKFQRLLLVPEKPQQQQNLSSVLSSIQQAVATSELDDEEGEEGDGK